MAIARSVRVLTLRQAQTQTIAQQRERLQTHVATNGWPLKDPADLP